MKQFWQNLIVATFTVLLTAVLGIAAFTYDKIISIDNRLVRIEEQIKIKEASIYYNDPLIAIRIP